MSKYDVILFDADGTLFDFDKAETFALRSSLRELSLPFNKTILREYKQINASLWLLLEQGKTTQSQIRTKRFELLHARFHMSGDPALTCDAFVKHLSQSVFLLPGAKQLLTDIHTFCDLYLVTNGITQVQKSRFALSGLSGFFKGLYISEEMGVSKPSKKYFDIIFDQSAITDLNKVLIVGDSLTSDIAGGNNAGIDTCWYNPSKTKNTTAHICDYEIAQLRELRRIIG